MKTHYVLIDYENVQPKNLAILNGHSVKVVVFVGATQKKVPADYPASLRAQGVDAEKIKIAGSGPNALDFHIAFYIGQFSAHSTNTHFHIISNDKGFDPLVRHLKGKNINVRRRGDLANMSLPRTVKTPKPAKTAITSKATKPAKPAKTATPAKAGKLAKAEKIEKNCTLKGKIDVIIRNFSASGQSQPANVKKLRIWINKVFQNKLSKAELNSLIDELCRRKIVVIYEDNVSFVQPLSGR